MATHRPKAATPPPEISHSQKVHLNALTSLTGTVLTVACALPGVPLDAVGFVVRRLLEFGANAIPVIEPPPDVPLAIARVHRAFVAARMAFEGAMSEPLDDDLQVGPEAGA